MKNVLASFFFSGLSIDVGIKAAAVAAVADDIFVEFINYELINCGKKIK